MLEKVMNVSNVNEEFQLKYSAASFKLGSFVCVAFMQQS